MGGGDGNENGALDAGGRGAGNGDDEDGVSKDFRVVHKHRSDTAGDGGGDSEDGMTLVGISASPFDESMEIDLDEYSHLCIPLYAYDVDHPLEVHFEDDTRVARVGRLRLGAR